MRLLILVFCVVFCSSCATIRFTNSEPTKGTVYQDKIHHIGLMGLYEYSEPVSPQKICKGKELSYIETEYSFLTWTINYIPSVINQLLFASAFYLPPSGLVKNLDWLMLFFSAIPMLYSPMSVEVACQASS